MLRKNPNNKMGKRELLAWVVGSELFVFCFLKIEPWHKPVLFFVAVALMNLKHAKHYLSLSEVRHEKNLLLITFFGL